MSGYLTDEQLCNDDPCTCGAAIHDPVLLARTARVYLAAGERQRMAEAKPGD